MRLLFLVIALITAVFVLADEPPKIQDVKIAGDNNDGLEVHEVREIRMPVPDFNFGKKGSKKHQTAKVKVASKKPKKSTDEL
jgi:hypothetical protein